MNTFNIYSWDTWFKSLDFKQLQQLRNHWLKILPLTKGFEYSVLTWDINQVSYEIANRIKLRGESDISAPSPTPRDA